MEEFWQEKHGSNDVYWISSTNEAEYILNILGLYEVSGLKVLDIGIGAGHLVRKFHEWGNTVMAVDISEIALERVKDICKTYHTSVINTLEPVDLATCHLVFQHCTDSECERILNDVKLTENGRFRFQFAFLRDGEEPSATVKDKIKNGTHHFRSKQDIMNIIERSNKRLIRVNEDIHYHGVENFSWAVFTVRNK